MYGRIKDFPVLHRAAPCRLPDPHQTFQGKSPQQPACDRREIAGQSPGHRLAPLHDMRMDDAVLSGDDELDRAHEARVLGGGFIARTLKPSELPLQNFDSAGQASSGEAAAQPSAARN